MKMVFFLLSHSLKRAMSPEPPHGPPGYGISEVFPMGTEVTSPTGQLAAFVEVRPAVRCAARRFRGVVGCSVRFGGVWGVLGVGWGSRNFWGWLFSSCRGVLGLGGCWGGALGRVGLQGTLLGVIANATGDAAARLRGHPMGL